MVVRFAWIPGELMVLVFLGFKVLLGVFCLNFCICVVCRCFSDGFWDLFM